jgi:uncharacterized membrane protein
MTEKLFWLFLLLILLGLFGIGYSLYSLKKRKIQTFLPRIPEFSYELDSVTPWKIASFWVNFLICFLIGIACVIVGLYGLFFV